MHVLPAAMEQWLTHLRANRRYSEHTLAGYRQDLHHLIQCHPGAAPEKLTESHIRQAVARLHGQGLKPRSLARALAAWRGFYQRSEEHTSELQSLMRISYAVLCFKKKTQTK